MRFLPQWREQIKTVNEAVEWESWECFKWLYYPTLDNLYPTSNQTKPKPPTWDPPKMQALVGVAVISRWLLVALVQ